MLSTFNGRLLAASLLLVSTLSAHALAADEITSKDVRDFVAQGLNEKLPDYIQLSYAEAAVTRLNYLFLPLVSSKSMAKKMKREWQYSLAIIVMIAPMSKLAMFHLWEGSMANR